MNCPTCDQPLPVRRTAPHADRKMRERPCDSCGLMVITTETVAAVVPIRKKVLK